jgi:hypothetical protein
LSFVLALTLSFPDSFFLPILFFLFFSSSFLLCLLFSRAILSYQHIVSIIDLINKMIIIVFRNDIENRVSISKVNIYYIVICVIRIIPKQAPIVVDLPVIGRILDIYPPTTSYDEVFNNSKSLLFIY